MSNKSGKVRVSFSSVNEKIFFSKEAVRISALTNASTLVGRFARGISRVSRSLSYTSTRTYGAFMLSFGFLSLILHLAKYFIFAEFDVQLLSIAVGIVFSSLAIPLLLLDKPMCVALQDNTLTDYIFFEFFAIKRMHRIHNGATIPPAAAVFLGFIPAGISFVLRAEDIAFVIVSSVVILISFVSPEFPLVLTIVSIPYLNAFENYEKFLLVMALVSFLSFLIKVAVGKRVYNFEIYDLFVIGFIGIIIASGIISGASLSKSILYAALTLFYFTASNLLINRRLADLAINAIIVSSVPVSILAIVDSFLQMSSAAPSPISGMLLDSTSHIAYLTVSTIFTVGFVIQKHAGWKKLLYSAVLTIQILSAALTMHPGIPFVLLGALLSYAVINMRRVPSELAVLFLGAAYTAVALFPDMAENLLRRIGFSATILPGSFEVAIDTFKNNPILGLGLDSGIEIGSFNLFTFLVTSVGSVGFALFVLLMFTRIRHVSYYRAYVRDSIITVDCNMSFIALLTLLMLGAETSFFSVPIIYCLFFILFGIGSATLRTAKKAYDDRLGYYKDQRSRESSAIDILLR